MRILVLGGTSFVGRAIVADAVRTGADVTLFGRGKTGVDLFPELTRLIGDWDTGDYAALRDGRWDAVVDVSGYVPRHVGQAMDALGDRARAVPIHLQPRGLLPRRAGTGLDRGHATAAAASCTSTSGTRTAATPWRSAAASRPARSPPGSPIPAAGGLADRAGHRPPGGERLAGHIRVRAARR